MAPDYSEIIERKYYLKDKMCQKLVTHKLVIDNILITIVYQN